MWRLSQLRRSVTAVREDDVTLVETLAAEERCNFEIDDSLISNAGSPAMVKQLQDIILKRKGKELKRKR